MGAGLQKFLGSNGRNSLPVLCHKGQELRGFNEMALASGMGIVTHLSPPHREEERPTGAGEAASSLRSVQVRAAGVSPFQTQSPGREQRKCDSVTSLTSTHAPLVLLGTIIRGGLSKFSGLVR